MFTPGYDPMMQYKQRHNELMAEARNHRLVKEALAARKASTRPPLDVVALIGKWLVTLGTRLEKRNELIPCGEAMGDQQGFNITL